MWQEFLMWSAPSWGVFGHMTHVTQVSSDKANIAAKHKEPVEVLSQLADTSTPQITGTKSVASVVAPGVLMVASGVLCGRSLFSLENHCKLLTSDGALMKTSGSLINQVAVVGQQHEAFGLQGKFVGVAQVDEAHPCHTSLTAPYAHRQICMQHLYCTSSTNYENINCYWANFLLLNSPCWPLLRLLSMKNDWVSD